MPISCFLNGEDDKNHKRIKEAFKSLEDKSFMYEDEDIITSIRLVRKFEINKRSGFVRFSLDLPIYSALVDFSKGYKKNTNYKLLCDLRASTLGGSTN